MSYWLMKSEPDAFSIDDLAARPNQTESWDGVRNYQVRNMFRDQFAPGDEAFFYHSSCAEPGIVGICEITSRGYPDPTQFDPKSKYYDPKAKPEEPRWMLVDVKFKRKLAQPVSLATLRDHADALEGFQLLAKGTRLSVIPVRAEHWKKIIKLAKA